MVNLKVPTIVVVVGEGGSGGALAIGVGDRVLMMENAVYSVITPEGCAAILWKDAAQASRAAECLKLTATDLQKFGLVDEVVPEFSEWKYNLSESVQPEKRDNSEVSLGLKEILLRNLKDLTKMSISQRRNLRFEKFRRMGEFEIGV